MTDQVTSIEQSKRLIEMGVPAEKASMIYQSHFTQGVPKLYAQPYQRNGYPPKEKIRDDVVPAFTVADLLAVLPKVMEDDEGVPFYLNIQYNRKEYSEIKYKGVYGILWSCFGASLLNNLVEAVDGVVTNGYELTL
jgi:hypothetical protein